MPDLGPMSNGELVENTISKRYAQTSKQLSTTFFFHWHFMHYFFAAFPQKKRHVKLP
jgi:hypothetical protein